jgi:hypothetical protein
MLADLKNLGGSASAAELQSAVEKAIRDAGEPVTTERVEETLAIVGIGANRRPIIEIQLYRHEFSGIPIIVADNVAAYYASVTSPGKNLSDIVSVVVPPFQRVFVEVQAARDDNSTNQLGLRSWGVLFEDATENCDWSASFGHREYRWVFGAAVVGEWRKGEPVGPLLRYLLPLTEDGTLFQGEKDGFGSLFLADGELPIPRWDYAVTPLLGSCLLALSFMHCKNVDIAIVEPPAALSKKHARRYGEPLSSYRVLEIEPMRQALHSDGHVSTAGLRQALHICRGHFKTFTDDAPLFGRLTGTYWWDAHVRGAAAFGSISKDYRIRIDDGLGRDYVPVNEHPELLPSAAESKGLDPDLGGRGLAAHNVTQNALAAAVGRAGWEPRRPRPEEPQYDLAWETPTAVWVAEVKSLTPQNEERQLRMAIGQVFRYQQLLDADDRPVRALVAVERPPTDDRWIDLFASKQVVLTWPTAFNLTIPDERES